MEKEEIKIGFDYRAIIEMVNNQKGEQVIDTRLRSLFDVQDSKVHVKNIRRSSGYAAKVVCIGHFGFDTILSLGTGIKKYGIVQDKMFWPTKDLNNNPANIVRDNANILQIFYSTDTLTAEITVIPTLRMANNDLKDLNISFEYFEANREEIYKLLDEQVAELNNFISLVDACEFTNKSYKKFNSNLLDIITYYYITDNEIKDYYPDVNQQVLANFILNRSL